MIQRIVPSRMAGTIGTPSYRHEPPTQERIDQTIATVQRLLDTRKPAMEKSRVENDRYEAMSEDERYAYDEAQYQEGFRR